MKKILLSLIVLLLSASCKKEGVNEKIYNNYSNSSALGKWIDIPVNYSGVKKTKVGNVHWGCKDFAIKDTPYTASVGPLTIDGEQDFYCYFISIEERSAKSSRPLTALEIPKSLMSENIITYVVEDIISYDSDKRIVTFDFKKSKFKYQIKN